MTFYELSFKLQHDCPYSHFSKNHPSAVISHWCNWSRDVLEIFHRDLRSRRVQQEIREMFKSIDSKIIRNSRNLSNLQVVIQHYACYKLHQPNSPTVEQRTFVNLHTMFY